MVLLWVRLKRNARYLETIRRVSVMRMRIYSIEFCSAPYRHVPYGGGLAEECVSVPAREKKVDGNWAVILYRGSEK